MILELAFTHPVDVILPGVELPMISPSDEILMRFLREVNGKQVARDIHRIVLLNTHHPQL